MIRSRSDQIPITGIPAAVEFSSFDGMVLWDHGKLNVLRWLAGLAQIDSERPKVDGFAVENAHLKEVEGQNLLIFIT
jgi:hypothetical protein